MNTLNIKGLGVAMVTPFNKKGEIDFTALEKLTSYLINNGTDYLVVQGTTGESPTLTKDERQATLDAVVKINDDRLPIVFGIGGNNTAAVINDFKAYNLEKVDAILSASPCYNKPTQEGIYQHYKALSENAPKPIIIYNVPGRTGSNILPKTTLRLANDFENIIAIKEASGDMMQIMSLIQNSPDNFLILSGDDPIAMPLIASGCDGLISVIGNAFPKQYSKLIKASFQGDISEARRLHYLTLNIIPMLFEEGNPAGIKEVLAQLKIMENNVRLPLINVSNELKQKLINETERITQDRDF